MDTSGKIRYITPENPATSSMMPLTDEQATILEKQSLGKRKNWMRNQPCLCGSGKKFKKCCWTKATKEQIKKFGVITESGIKNLW
jgi:hypothetical protein